MPTRRIEKIKAWSFSRYDCYEECAQKARFKFIDKIKEPAICPKCKTLNTSDVEVCENCGEYSFPLARGGRIHDEAEGYSIGKIRRMPKSLELFEEEFKALRKIKRKLQTEQELAVDKNWRPVAWRDWNNAWLRCKMDCMFTMSDGVSLKIIDYKTGKHTDYKTGQVKANAIEQLDLYATFGFLFGGDHIERIECELWFLDQGIIWGAADGEPKVYERKDEMHLRKAWEKKSRPMLSDQTFKPNPGDACRFCYFKKNQGGHCEY